MNWVGVLKGSVGHFYTSTTHYKLVKEPLHRNEAVSKLLAEERNRRARELSCNHKMTDLHQHVHGVTAEQRKTAVNITLTIDILILIFTTSQASAQAQAEEKKLL